VVGTAAANRVDRTNARSWWTHARAGGCCGWTWTYSSVTGVCRWSCSGVPSCVYPSNAAQEAARGWASKTDRCERAEGMQCGAGRVCMGGWRGCLLGWRCCCPACVWTEDVDGDGGRARLGVSNGRGSVNILEKVYPRPRQGHGREGSPCGRVVVPELQGWLLF
jgi:hypothetical protein